MPKYIKKRKREDDKQKFGCIYLLTNLITLLCYVGKTIDFKRRMGEHKRRKRKAYISYSIQKHGWHNFKKEILIDNIPEEALNNLEIYYIAFYNTMCPYGYNLTRGGEGTSGYKASKETREKLSQATIRHQAKRDRFGSVDFQKKHNKYRARGPGPMEIHIGMYFTRAKAEKALKHFLKSGERMESDLVTRKRGKGCIVKRGKQYRAIYTRNKKKKSKSFGTVEECEEWLQSNPITE